MKKIIVPTDFSEHAGYALEVAAAIAKKTNAKIYLLHVMDNLWLEDGVEGSSRYQDVTTDGVTSFKIVDREFDKLIKKHKLNNYKLLQEHKFSNVYDTVLKHANGHNVDLIVIGAYGSNGSKETFIGSNTEKIIRMADTPVLTVKHRYEDFNPQNIVFASLFLDEAKYIFPKLKTFSELYEAKLHLLKVITPNRFERTPLGVALMNKFAKIFNLKDFTSNLYADFSIEGGILNFSSEINADIIAITTHGKRRLSYLINGNLTDGIVNESAKAILSFKVLDVKEEISDEFRKDFYDYYFGEYGIA
jgi:nucleotide-binding universal stress UspA family protein